MHVNIPVENINIYLCTQSFFGQGTTMSVAGTD